MTTLGEQLRGSVEAMTGKPVPMPAPTPLELPRMGLHFDVPFAEYLHWPLLSQSTLKEGRQSMAHLRAALDGERVKVPTDDMILGSALHTAFLEPETVPDRVVKWTGERRYGKEWDAFCAQHKGKIILTENAYAKLGAMMKSLRRHPVVRQWLSKIEHVEVAAVGKVEGVPCKGRCDAYTTEPLIDLKKVASGDIENFTSAVLRFGYHIQGFMYRELFQRERFLLLAVEDSPPFDVIPYELSPALLRAGEREAVPLLAHYKVCEKSGQWPGRSDEIVQLEVPEWLADRMDADRITLDGAGVEG